MAGTSIYLSPTILARLDRKLEQNRRTPHVASPKEKGVAAALAREHGTRMANEYLKGLQPPTSRSALIEQLLDAHLPKEA